MTGYQLFALSMPVITGAAVGATGLFVSWYWGRPREDKRRQDEGPELAETLAAVEEALLRATQLIERAQRQMRSSEFTSRTRGESRGQETLHPTIR
jgi:hypothetical protein